MCAVIRRAWDCRISELPEPHGNLKAKIIMALYLKKVLDNKAEIAVWQITETEEELKALSSTPSDEMEEISWIKSESLRKQRLAVRALLNELFDEKVYLSHHDNGKPFLENRVTNISITHTDKYVAVILHETEDVGIDVESLDRDFSAVELKALSEDEIEDWMTIRETSSSQSTGVLKRQSSRDCHFTTWILQSRSKSSVSILGEKANLRLHSSIRMVMRTNSSSSILPSTVMSSFGL